MSLANILEGIALTVTSLFAIRETVSKNLKLPVKYKNRWWWYIIYNKKEPPLCSRTYSLMQEDAKINRSRRSISEDLIQLAGRHIKYYNHGFYHGRSQGSRETSNYFINTLEASYNNSDLHIMQTAIRNLVSDQDLSMNLDYILCLKSGNQILARNSYADHPEITCICRHDTSSGYHAIETKLPTDMYSIQYENLDALLDRTKHHNSRKLNGIAIDCSVSTGSGLKESIERFNNEIAKNSEHINPIEHAFVLYCHHEIDDSLFNFTLHRYFDMTEDVRKLIYDKHNNDDSNWYKDIYKYIKDHSLLKK